MPILIVWMFIWKENIFKTEFMLAICAITNVTLCPSENGAPIKHVLTSIPFNLFCWNFVCKKFKPLSQLFIIIIKAWGQKQTSRKVIQFGYPVLPCAHWVNMRSNWRPKSFLEDIHGTRIKVEVCLRKNIAFLIL